MEIWGKAQREAARRRMPDCLNPRLLHYCQVADFRSLNVVKCLSLQKPSTNLAEIWLQLFPAAKRPSSKLVVTRCLISE